MKKILIFISFLFIAALGSYADERKSVELSDEHKECMVKLDLGNVFFTLTESKDDENATVLVEIENINETYYIYIFGEGYSEKDLKKCSPSITFDKVFPGPKGHRKVESYDGKVPRFVRIDQSRKNKLSEIQVKAGEAKKCLIPFYLAEQKDKTFLGFRTGGYKMVLLEKIVHEFEIKVAPKIKPDENFNRLEEECNALIEDIGKQSFCNHPKHKPSLKEQEKPYKEKIDSLKSEINKILDRLYEGNTFSSDYGPKKYRALRDKLVSIDFTLYERDCGNSAKHEIVPPPSSTHNCKFCNLSLQQIYHKLDDFYKKLYNGKATKESVMDDVKLLYKCCTVGDCKKHASSWKNSEYKSKIEDRYDRINKF